MSLYILDIFTDFLVHLIPWSSILMWDSRVTRVTKVFVFSHQICYCKCEKFCLYNVERLPYETVVFSLKIMNETEFSFVRKQMFVPAGGGEYFLSHRKKNLYESVICQSLLAVRVSGERGLFLPKHPFCSTEGGAKICTNLDLKFTWDTETSIKGLIMIFVYSVSSTVSSDRDIFKLKICLS